MTDSEVNKIIAEFMDNQIELKIVGDKLHLYDRLDSVWYLFNDKYTKSLDALVPVWDKLGKPNRFMSEGTDDGVWSYHFSLDLNRKGNKKISYTHDISLQQAAAHATAKAILELTGE